MQEELYLLFENYLNNELSVDEITDFENKLQNDVVFKNQYEAYKETTQFLNLRFSAHAADFKENLKTISANHFKDEAKKDVKVFSLQSKWFAVAATVVIFIGVLFFNQSASPTFSDYNTHNEAQFVERSEQNASLKAAQNAFNTKKYDEAVVLFENALLESNSPEIELYYGISLLEIDKTKEADKIFTNLKNGNSVYKEEAIWYLALSSLKQKKVVACKKYLQQITKDAEKYSVAQKLLNDLE